MLKLTMHMYPKKFVEISFLESIISKEKLSCSLFWIYELYNSGFKEDCFELLYECYFYFYAIKNKQFINIIHKNYENWQKTGDKYIIGKLVKNLKHKSFDLDIFKLKIEMDNQKKSRMKRYKKEAWENEYGIILRYLYRKDYDIMVSRIKNIPQNEMGLFMDSVVRYFKSSGIHMEKYNYLIEYIDTNHPFVYVYVVYIIMLLDNNKLYNERKIVSCISNVEKKLIDSFDTHEGEYNFKILNSHRLHEVASDFISIFNLDIQDVNILEETRNNWKAHITDTPFWLNKNTDEYDLEYDEQTLRCQELSVFKANDKKTDVILERYK